MEMLPKALGMRGLGLKMYLGVPLRNGCNESHRST